MFFAYPSSCFSDQVTILICLREWDVFLLANIGELERLSAFIGPNWFIWIV